MLLIELTTLSTSAKNEILGLDSTPIEVITFVDVAKITHMSENTENKNLTNIYLNSGAPLITPMRVLELISYLQDHDDEPTSISD